MPRALARELLAEGGALAQPSECRMTQEKRLKDGKTVAKEGDIRVFQTHPVGWHDPGGYASLHPRLRATRFARAFDLSGRAAVFILCRGDIFLLSKRKIWVALSVKCVLMMIFADNGVIYSKIEGV